MPMAAAILLLGCVASDGDTIRCNGRRYRLLAIDAPELPGHCNPGRQCVAGNAEAAKAELQSALGSGRVRFRRVATDRWGRSVGVGVAGGLNLSCHMLRSARAVYVPRWDTGGAIKRACGDVALAVTADPRVRFDRFSTERTLPKLP